MKYFSMLIKPASSLCNLRCRYCFYCDVAENRKIPSYGVMSEETMNILIDKTLGFFREEVTITFAFQGGEPTVAGLDYFRRFIRRVNLKKKSYHQIQYALQTNATLLNDEWIRFLKQNRFLVGVSLDGYALQHDAMRPDAKGQGTFARILENIEKLRQAKINFNILTVLTRQLAEHQKELFDFYLRQHLDYIQLIPCLPPLEDQNDPYSLTPQTFFRFYDEFFQLWLEELKQDHYISVTLFDNLIPLFDGVPPQQCGFLGFCSMQFVVESDGSVYPCDFYVLDEYKLGNLRDCSLADLSKSKILSGFLQGPRRSTKLCETCRYAQICHGQCKRLNICYFDEEFCGYQAFIQKHEAILTQLAMILRRQA